MALDNPPRSRPLPALTKGGSIRAVQPHESAVLGPVRIPEAGAVHQRVRQPRPTALAKDFATLLYLLDSDEHREILVGENRPRWNLMSARAQLGDKPMTDVDYLRIRAELERLEVTDKPLKWSTEDVYGALQVVAQGDCFDPLRDYVRAFPEWDKTQRIEDELARRIGINFMEDGGPIQARYLKRWMLGAIGRALQPGLKADSMLVLSGPQERYKSTFLRELFGDEWVMESKLDVEDKDGASAMGLYWCVEWAELTAMRRADAEAVKHFLSIKADTYRPPYGRELRTVPRRAVVCGTTNETEFLQDPTGHRRFWVVNVSRPIDFQWVRDNRAQLWAEARAAYEAGEQTYLTLDEREEHRKQAEDFVQVDEWEDPIKEFLEDLKFDTFKLADVADKALALSAKQLDMGTQKRIASILRRQGCTKGGGGKQGAKVWRKK